jgi:prepilin peptidase CpaA
LLRLSDAVVVAAVAASGGISAIVDLRSRRVPNPLTMGIAALGIVLAATHVTNVSVTAALVGCALGFVLMLPGHVIGATGAGDVKLFAALGTLLGPAHIVIAFVYTAIAGGIVAVIVAVMRRRLRETVGRTAVLVRSRGANVGDIEKVSTDNRFAYAPAIAIGALVAALGF